MLAICGECEVRTRTVAAEEQIGPEFLLQVRIVLGEHRAVIKFALNLSAYIRGRWRAVYRVDNYHGFLHEQRLWLTPRPFPLHGFDGWHPKDLFIHFRNHIRENAARFKEYMEATLRGD
jgi:hypothetical protein